MTALAEPTTAASFPTPHSSTSRSSSPSTTRRPTSDRACGGCTPTCDRDFPFTAIITIADNASTDATWLQRAATWPPSSTACGPCTSTPRAAAARCSRSGRASTARVVAYMDVDLSTDLTALLPLVAPLLSGHSDVAIGSRLSRSSRVVRGPKRELISRSLQPAAAHDAAGPLLRRAVRLQGDAHRVRAGAAAARPGHRVVLRHRTAGARRTQRAADRRGAGRLGRRPGQPRRHRRRPPWPTCAGSPGSARCAGRAATAAARTARPARPRRAASRRRPAVAGRAGGALRRRRRAVSTLAYLLLFLLLAAAARRPGREPGRPADHRDRQHRGQPPLHLRRARRAAWPDTSCKGWWSSASASALTSGSLRAARPVRSAPRPAGRADRPGRRQPGRDRAALRAAARMGLRPPDRERSVSA